MTGSTVSAGKGLTMKAILIVLVLTSAAFASGILVGQLTATKSGPVVIDDYGRTIKLTTQPKRIVSVSPTPTEILFAVGAGSMVVGVDDYSDYPAAVNNIARVGNFVLNVETILSLKPDLIISSDLVSTDQLAQLEAKGIPYIVLAARTLQDVFKDIKLVGVITGHINDALSLVDSLEARVVAITEKTSDVNLTKPRVLVEFYPMWTYGPGSFGDDLIKLAGGTNIAANASQEYSEVTDEFVIAQDPQIIVYTVGTNYNGTSPQTIADRPGWSGISAVSSGKMYPIDDNLISRYGPRIVDGLEALAHILHPELF